MGKSYEKGTREMQTYLNEALDMYHSDLKEVGIRVALFRVSEIDDNGQSDHALRLHGHDADAVASNYNLKRRVQTDFDCEISVEATAWDSMTDRGRLALIDHELTHFKLKFDRNGVLKMDDIGRPMLEMRKDSFMLTGFFEVIIRHGQEAGEAGAVSRVYAEVQKAIQEAEAAAAQFVQSRKAPKPATKPVAEEQLASV